MPGWWSEVRSCPFANFASSTFAIFALSDLGSQSPQRKAAKRAKVSPEKPCLVQASVLTSAGSMTLRNVSQSVRTRSHSWISIPLASKKLRMR